MKTAVELSVPAGDTPPQVVVPEDASDAWVAVCIRDAGCSPVVVDAIIGNFSAVVLPDEGEVPLRLFPSSGPHVTFLAWEEDPESTPVGSALS